MFKKAFKVSSNNNISGKDRKKLITELSKYYDPECLNSLLSKNSQVITLNKVSGSKVQLYISGDTPILFDTSGKGDIYPTRTKWIFHSFNGLISFHNLPIPNPGSIS